LELDVSYLLVKKKMCAAKLKYALVYNYINKIVTNVTKCENTQTILAKKCILHVHEVLYSKNEKIPRGIRPRRCSPPSPPRGAKYVTVTQDKGPWLCSKRHDEYFFGQVKTGGLGQVTPPPPKKKPWKKKRV